MIRRVITALAYLPVALVSTALVEARQRRKLRRLLCDADGRPR